MIICELLACVILLSLHVSGNTNGSVPSCIVSIRVPRNSLVRVPVMTEFHLNCTVITDKCQEIPKISWCKIYGNDCKALNKSMYIKTMWKNTIHNDGIAFLMFLNISMEDAGLYRCKSQNSVGHTINVTVTEHEEDSGLGNQNNTSNKTGNKQEGLKEFWSYVYICGGLIGLVVIVITVSLFIIRCKGRKSTRKEITTTNQYLKTQRSAPTTPSRPHPTTHSPSTQMTSAVYSPYDTPPVRAGSHRDRPSSERLNMTESKACRNNVRSTEEENPLVYASLNYQAGSRGPRRKIEQEIEPSEYAAIRFR